MKWFLFSKTYIFTRHLLAVEPSDCLLAINEHKYIRCRFTVRFIFFTNVFWWDHCTGCL